MRTAERPLPLTFEGLDPITRDRLELFASLVRKWTPTINLISASTVANIWDRHIADSLQLVNLRQGQPSSWADLGTGAGFPGIVVAIAAAEHIPDMHVTLIESDQRKAAFLRSVSRETGVAVTIIAERIEDLPALGVDVVSARALAPLSQLCGYAARHLAPQGTALFLKGANVSAEIAAAKQAWQFDLEELPSETDPQAKILRLKDLRHA